MFNYFYYTLTIMVVKRINLCLLACLFLFPIWGFTQLANRVIYEIDENEVIHILELSSFSEPEITELIPSEVAEEKGLTRREMKELIREELNKEIKVVGGEMTTSGKYEIWYDSYGDATNPTVILILGFMAPAPAWPKEFIQPIVDDGYHVVVFDNRDMRYSSFDTEGRRRKAYHVDAMADDAMAVLKATGKEKAHFAGISLGGLIAQNVAIRYPDSVESLTLFSTTYNYNIAKVSLRFYMHEGINLLRYGFFPDNPEKNMAHLIRSFNFLEQDKTITQANVKYMVNVFRPIVLNQHDRLRRIFWRQIHAVTRSPSHRKALKDLKTPTLIIHGNKDPLIKIRNGKKCHKAIPNSKFVTIEGCGHVPQLKYWKEMAQEFITFQEERTK